MVKILFFLYQNYHSFFFLSFNIFENCIDKFKSIRLFVNTIKFHEIIFEQEKHNKFLLPKKNPLSLSLSIHFLFSKFFPFIKSQKIVNQSQLPFLDFESWKHGVQGFSTQDSQGTLLLNFSKRIHILFNLLYFNYHLSIRLQSKNKRNDDWFNVSTLKCTIIYPNLSPFTSCYKHFFTAFSSIFLISIDHLCHKVLAWFVFLRD